MSVLEAAPIAAPFTMPPLPALVRHAIPRVVESMIMPPVVTYAGIFLFDLSAGLIAGLLWVFGCALWRLSRRAVLPGLVILAMAAITARTAFALVTGNSVFYFLPPIAGVFCVALVFLFSAPTRRPLARRVACDLVPMPARVQEHPAMRRFFRRQSLMWGCVQLGNASLSAWVLFHESVQGFLLLRTSAVAVLLSLAALAALLDFRRTLSALRVEAEL
ncbi:VC0807 family protein [Nonomuraea sp. NPDC050310]|uniref:VC0807 family protein n=1 Tax=unclassified Nonomuraea TaxID=2593643 RepID=UPI0033CCAFA1